MNPLPCARTESTARFCADLVRLGQAVRRRRLELAEDVGAVDDRRLLGMRQRHLDDLDPHQRRLRVLVGRRAHAARQLVRRADRRRAGDVDVDVVLVLGILEHRVRVRPAARLHVGDELRVLDVADVEHAHAAHAILAHRVRGIELPARLAVDATVVRLGRHEHEVLVDRHVVLRRRALVRRDQRRVRRIGHVPDHRAVVVPLDGVLAEEGEVGVGLPEEARRRDRLGVDLEAERRFAGVHAGRP